MIISRPKAALTTSLGFIALAVSLTAVDLSLNNHSVRSK